MYSVFVLLILLHCFIFILVLLLCCVSRSSLYCNIPSDLCTLCLSCYYFYIVLSLYLYCCYVVYTDHHFTVIYLQICVLCVCLVITSTLCTVLLSRYLVFFSTCVLCVCLVITSTLFYLYCCYVVYTDHHFTVLYLQICVLCVCLLLLLHCFIFILVLLLCCVSRSYMFRLV